MVPVTTAQTLVYECGDYEFIARTGAGEIALYLPDDYRVLGQVEAASGAKYTDDNMVFWSRGDEAVLDLGYRKYSDCRLNRQRAPWEEARRRGVQFRAVGQEPGWYLEIQDERQILFVAAYGSQRVLLPTPASILEEGLEIYEVADERHQLRVTITQQHCMDSMSGEDFDNSVSVELDGDRFQGCGLALEAWWDQPE